jgi:hypothetical protein
MIAMSNEFVRHDSAAMLTQTPRLRAPLFGSLRKFSPENILPLTVAAQNRGTMWLNRSFGQEPIALFAPPMQLVNRPTRIKT